MKPTRPKTAAARSADGSSKPRGEVAAEPPTPPRGAAPSGSEPPQDAELAAEEHNSSETERARRDGWIRTGEMARLTNNTLRTVRFYEEAGILQPVGRTEGGHRLFERAQLDRLLLVSDMREAGFSLDEIRNLLETKRRATSASEAASEAIRQLKERMQLLRNKVEVLTRLHDDLSRTVETASECLHCSGGDLFPERCGECPSLESNSPLPRGMRVLWSIQHRSASGG